MTVKLGMVIDRSRCVACGTCTTACKVANNLSDDVWWNRVVNEMSTERDAPEGTYPNLKMSTHTLACQHCENPACVSVCPVEATYKREEDGIVMQDGSLCIGCKLCLDACPYTGVRTFVEEPKWHIDFKMGDENAAEHVAGTVEKCTFCAHRIDSDESPACVKYCPARARAFGDLNDPESDVAKKLASASKKEQLKVEEGTSPSVFIIN